MARGVVRAAALGAVALLWGCAAAASVETLDPAPSVSAVPPVSAGSASSVRSAAPSPSGSPVATVAEPDAGVLPRTLAYGALLWTVTDASISTEGSLASLVVDLEVRNDSPHVGYVATTARLVAVLPDGSVVPGTDQARTSAPPQSTTDGRYAFTLPVGTTFEGLALRFEDPGREPSWDLPLSGDAPEIEASETIEVGEALDIGLPGIDMTWLIEQLTIGRDWPLPIGMKGGTLVPGARSATGERFVGVVARVDVGRCACRGGVLDQIGSVRLLVDGRPYAAVAADSSRAIMVADTFSEAMLTFALPASADEAVLQVGPLEEPEQQVTLTLALPGAGIVSM